MNRLGENGGVGKEKGSTDVIEWTEVMDEETTGFLCRFYVLAFIEFFFSLAF